MTDKIKLVYDWYGPHYPLRNNQIDLKSALTLAKDKDNVDICPSRTLHLFKDNTGYEYVISHTLNQDDYFLYELTLNISEGSWLNNYSFDLFEKQCNIPDNILKMIKNNNGYFLLEACQDSINLDAFFDNVHILFITHKVPINKAILLLGHANVKEEYNKWCENKGILPIDKATIFSYQWGEINASKEIQNYIATENLNFYKRSKTFLCYNRKTKPHRSDLLALFYKFDVLADSYFSMPEHCVDSGVLWKTLYRLGVPELDAIDAKRRQIILNLVDVNKTDDLQALFPLNIDGITNVPNMEKIINQSYSVYDSTLISVVTESNFVSNQIYHSEKTWKPIANKHPFIIVGPTGSLENLKSLGYKTFSDFWDEAYDLETKDTIRLMRIASLCKNISNWSTSKKKDFFYESMCITKHNYNLLKSIYTERKRNDFWETFRDWHLR
jgi:hypothetical protein